MGLTVLGLYPGALALATVVLAVKVWSGARVAGLLRPSHGVAASP